MRLCDHPIRKLYYLCVVLACVPFLAGWQVIDLQEFLVSQRAHEQVRSEESLARMKHRLDKYPALSAYTIFEKAAAAGNALTSMRVDSQMWLQSTQAHLKTSFTTYINKLDNYGSSGSVSESELQPRGMSSSQWVQTYQTQGIPFTWDIENRAWEMGEVSIPDGESKGQIAYGLMRSLYSVDEGSVDLSTVDIVGVEQRHGRDCFVLQFDIDRATLKKLKAMGTITERLWVDTETFLPQMVRAEGSLDDVHILQISEYTSFNEVPPLLLPGSVVKESLQERVKLQDKIPPITKELAGIRGWKPLEKVSVEFIDRPALRAYLIKEYDAQFTAEETDARGLLLKMLGLLEKEADYRSVVINSEVEGIAGLYDPKLKKVFVGDWIPPFVGEAVIAHEIAHAYQDQEIGLEESFQAAFKAGSFDKESALSALAEGEATAVMLDYLLKGEDQGFKDLDDVFELIEQRLYVQDSRSEKGITYNLYGWGARFVQSYLKEHSWADLSALYRDPPSATKQIMHPYKYASREAPSEMKPSVVLDRLGSSWKKWYRTHLGEFFIMLSLRQNVDAKTVLNCTKRYIQDDIGIYRDKDNRQLVVFVSQWDSAKDAEAFLQLFRQSLVKKYPKNHLEEQKDYAILSTDDTQIFMSAQRDDQVEVVWTQSGNAAEFTGLAQSIFGQLNPEI